MWSPPGITEPTLIRRYGLMMSDLQGLITKSTSVTFQHIITPLFPPTIFSPAATSDKKRGKLYGNQIILSTTSQMS